jgi:Uma2 family endonuclease
VKRASRSPAAKFYTYPDLSVACDRPVFDLRDKMALTNPTLIFEVLSPRTETYDRGLKFEYFKQIDALQEYVLVAQACVRVERFSRQVNGGWKTAVFDSLDDALDLPATGCRVVLREIYDKVTFG